MLAKQKCNTTWVIANPLQNCLQICVDYNIIFKNIVISVKLMKVRTITLSIFWLTHQNLNCLPPPPPLPLWAKFPNWPHQLLPLPRTKSLAMPELVPVSRRVQNLNVCGHVNKVFHFLLLCFVLKLKIFSLIFFIFILLPLLWLQFICGWPGSLVLLCCSCLTHLFSFDWWWCRFYITWMPDQWSKHGTSEMR